MKKDSFEKKLAAYVATAAAYLATHPVNADAQIMYTDVIPDDTIQNSFFNLDLNNDGVVDFKLQNGPGNPYSGLGSCTLQFANSNNIIGLNSNMVRANQYGTFYPVNNLAPIGTGDQFIPDGLLCLYSGGSCPNVVHSTTSFGTSTYTFWNPWGNHHGNFCGVNKIVGLEVESGGNTYYGWARLDVTDNGIVLKDYAVNTIPDSSIVAGSGACNLANYTVTPNGNQFLCGTDSVTVTLHNTTGENIQWLRNGDWLVNETDSVTVANQQGNYMALVSDSVCSVIVNGANFSTDFFDVSCIKQDASCGEPNGSLDVTISSSSYPFTFLWSNGETTEDLNNLHPGNYSLVVNSVDCGINDSLTFYIINTGTFPSPTISYSGNTLSTNSFVSYQWYLNGSLIPGAQGHWYTIQQSGYYQVEVTNTDGCFGMSDSLYVSFTGIGNIESQLFQVSIEHKQLLFHLADNELMSAQIDIVNELGQLAASVTVTNQNPSADLSALPAGIYFYHIRSKQKTYSGKFIIE